MKDTIGVGLVGLGVVGQATVQLLQENKQEIRRWLGATLQIVAASNRTKDERIKLLPQNCQFYSDPSDLLKDPRVDILVELIGGTDTALAIIKQAIEATIPVVTANKAMVAENLDTLINICHSSQTSFRYEAAVAGAVPIISSLNNSTIANSIVEVKGILNGTCNYILSKMSAEQLRFATALQQAQSLGYAEADPTLDIEGWDAYHKTVILALHSFGKKFKLDNCARRGITNMELLDFQYAKEFGYKIKLISWLKYEIGKLQFRVEPTLLTEDSMLAQLDGALNGVEVTGNYSGNLFFAGAGAGGKPTASAVVADCMNIAKELREGYASASFPMATDCEVAQTLFCKHYIRMSLFDVSGSLTKVTQLFSEHSADIEQISQNHHKDDKQTVPLALIIKEYSLQNLDTLLSELTRLEAVKGDIVWYPVH